MLHFCYRWREQALHVYTVSRGARNCQQVPQNLATTRREKIVYCHMVNNVWKLIWDVLLPLFPQPPRGLQRYPDWSQALEGQKYCCLICRIFICNYKSHHYCTFLLAATWHLGSSILTKCSQRNQAGIHKSIWVHKTANLQTGTEM